MYYQKMQGVSVRVRDRKMSVSSQRKSDDANYYRAMAMHKGDSINIPCRKFIGHHPDIDTLVMRNADNRVREFVDSEVGKN